MLFGEELGENLSQGGELLRSPFGVPALTFNPSGGEIVSASQLGVRLRIQGDLCRGESGRCRALLFSLINELLVGFGGEGNG